MRKKCQKYQKQNKPVHRKELTNNTAYSIVAQYQSEFRGFAAYYQLANDLHRLNSLKWIMEQSLAKTLATKLKVTVKKVHKKFGATWTVDGKRYKGLQVTVPREGKDPLIAKWGGIPLKKRLQAVLNDQPPLIWPSRSELEKRLLADTCELCGSTDRVEVYHIRALKDLERKGRQEKPRWAKVMSARKRKTLVVCWSCHRNIHAGRPVMKPQTGSVCERRAGCAESAHVRFGKGRMETCRKATRQPPTSQHLAKGSRPYRRAYGNGYSIERTKRFWTDRLYSLW